MKTVGRILRLIDAISDRTGFAVSFLLLVSMVVVLYEISVRYVFNVSQTWAPEMSIFPFGAAIALGGAYTLLHKGHVRMDIFYSRWSPKAQAAMDIATFVVFLGFIGVLLWFGTQSLLIAIELGEKSESAWRPVIWPIRLMIPLGALLMLLQGLAGFTRNVLTLAGKETFGER